MSEPECIDVLTVLSRDDVERQETPEQLQALCAAMGANVAESLRQQAIERGWLKV